jgi:hypothetical protein
MPAKMPGTRPATEGWAYYGNGENGIHNDFSLEKGISLGYRISRLGG